MANIKDVAKLAGVSVTTVSRVLNNKGYISQDTYESVYKAIDQLDYVPNQIARNLFRQKSYYISLIVPDSSHPFWAEITKYIEKKLYKHHYKLFLCNTGDTEDKERDYIKMMRENMVDGIILGTHMLAESEYQNLDRSLMCLRIWIWSIIKISFKYPVSSWLYENSLAEDCIRLLYAMPSAGLLFYFLNSLSLQRSTNSWAVLERGLSLR